MFGIRKCSMLLSGVAVFGIMASRPAAAQVTFTFTTVDVPEKMGYSTLAVGINNRGVIVGQYLLPNTLDLHGFIYQGGAFTDITVPGAAGGPSPLAPWNYFGAAFNITNAGSIVGAYADAQGSIHTYVLKKDGSFDLIPDPLPNGIDNGALGLNDAGTLTGEYISADFSQIHGWMRKKGAVTILDYPGALGTIAGRINDKGQIVGAWFDDSFTSHGFLLDRDVWTTIDVPGAAWTDARNINSFGQIIGNYGDGLGVQHGFLLDHGVYYTIDFPGGLGTNVFGINDHGQIVGGTADWSHGLVATIKKK